MSDHELRYVLDVAGLSVLIWVLIVWLRRSKAQLALAGMGVLGLAYLAARVEGLELTASMLLGFLGAAALILLFTFQRDVRRLLDRIGQLGRRRSALLSNEPIEAMLTAVDRMAANRVGALVVIPGRESIDRLVHGGVSLEGKVSVPLLLSLFDPTSPGHDGAAVLEGGSITSFGLHLPLSTNEEVIGALGTRHASAVGLSEACDAMCVIVSEERGTVSLARDGQLWTVDREGLKAALLSQLKTERRKTPLSARRILMAVTEPVVAVAFALAIWLVVVPGAHTTTREFDVPVVVENVPTDYELIGTDPSTVTVSLSGPRREMYLLETGAVGVVIDAWATKLGRRTFVLTDTELRYPPQMRVERVAPRRVHVLTQRRGAPP